MKPSSKSCRNTKFALRGMIEEFSANCGFIFTCNYVNRIIPVIHIVRCPIYDDFAIPKDEEQTLQGEFFVRALNILKQENIEFDKERLFSCAKIFSLINVEF